MPGPGNLNISLVRDLFSVHYHHLCCICPPMIMMCPCWLMLVLPVLLLGPVLECTEGLVPDMPLALVTLGW